jgi:hypothetical protein
MRTVVLLVVLLGQIYNPPQPSGPATTPNPAYPLHIRILVVNRNWNRFGSHGYGRADLLGPQPHGFDYTFDCDPPFLHNMHKDEFYQARWKKQDLELEILTQKIGSTQTNKCDLKVAMKDAPYGRYDASQAQPAAAASPSSDPH